MNKLLYSLIFLTCASTFSLEGIAIEPSMMYRYPNFEHIPKSKAKRFKPFLLPLDHPLKIELDNIFSSRITANESTLAEAGFVELCSRESIVKVVKHPNLPGVVIKLYLDNETRLKKNIEGWDWFARRCEGARNVRNLIAKKNIKHFSVPDKWIYPLPNHPASGNNPVILVASDMDLTSAEESQAAWANLNNKKVIDELYLILDNGYASTWLPWNIPYTHSGKFSCIDTEYPKRDLELRNVTSFLSPKMQKYWKSLIR